MPTLDWHLTLTDIVWDSRACQPLWWMEEVDYLDERSEKVRWIPTRRLIGDWAQDQGWREFPDEPNGAWSVLRRLGEPHGIDRHPIQVHELTSPLGSVYEVGEDVTGTHDLVVYEAFDLPFVPVEVRSRYKVSKTRLLTRDGRDAAAIQNFVEQQGLITFIADRKIDPASPAPWLALRPRDAVRVSQAFTRAHPNWMKSWGLTEADLADEWAWSRACRPKTSRLTRWWHTTVDWVDKAINGVDRPPEHHRSAGPQPKRWRAFTWALSSTSDFHDGALVMRLQPLDGEKPAALNDRVVYRVCRACGYGFIGDIELRTSGGHGMGREIVRRIIGPHPDLQWATSTWKPSAVGFWEEMSAELAVDIVQNGPRPANCPHACEPFSLDVLQVSDFYYPAHLVQPVV
jgi:hypothetical protein